MSAPTPDSLRPLLPEEARARLVSLRVADGVATLVLDAAGLEPPARGALEAAVQALHRP